MILAKKITVKINKLGEKFTVNGNTYTGIFKPLDSGTASTYLNDVDTMGILNPGLLLITAPDAAIAVDNAIVRDTRTYYVLRTFVHRLKGEPIFMLALLG